MGGAGDETAFQNLGRAVDGAGNVYVTATFDQTCYVGTNALVSADYGDVFLAKLAADPSAALRFGPALLTGAPGNRAISLDLIGVDCRTPIVLEASTDLRTWTAIHTQSAPVETFSVTDAVNPAGKRFYRAFVP